MSQPSYCATTSSMEDSLVILEPRPGICSITVPFGHCAELEYVVFASFIPPGLSNRSASGRGMPASDGMIYAGWGSSCATSKSTRGLAARVPEDGLCCKTVSPGTSGAEYD